MWRIKRNLYFTSDKWEDFMLSCIFKAIIQFWSHFLHEVYKDNT